MKPNIYLQAVEIIAIALIAIATVALNPPVDLLAVPFLGIITLRTVMAMLQI